VIRIRFRAGALLLLGCLLVAGCGGGKHVASSTTRAPVATTATTPTTTAPAGTPTATSPSGPKPPRPQNTTTDETGGTIPAHTDVVLTGRGGRVGPANVRVAPFVAVNIALTSADGGSYVLTVAGHRIEASAAHKTATLSLPGIPSGRTYVLKASRGPSVTVVSSAEPGP
jgi:hypothetical protein